MYNVKKIDLYHLFINIVFVLLNRALNKMQSSNLRTMFCKICRDAGRDDYTSHNVRGPGGNVTCKYLASIVCRYCGQKGHTIGYCSVRSKNESAERTREYLSRIPIVEKTVRTVKSKPVVRNPFALLDEREEGRCENEDEVMEKVSEGSVDEKVVECVETDDESSSESIEREYDEEDMENARNCTVDFSTIPLIWGKWPTWEVE